MLWRNEDIGISPSSCGAISWSFQAMDVWIEVLKQMQIWVDTVGYSEVYSKEREHGARQL